MFEQLSDKLEGIFKRLRGQSQLTEENVAETLREIRVGLLSADVNFKTVKDFINTVKEKAIGADVLQSLTPGQVMVKILHDEYAAALPRPRRRYAHPPHGSICPSPSLSVSLSFGSHPFFL